MPEVKLINSLKLTQKIMAVRKNKKNNFSTFMGTKFTRPVSLVVMWQQRACIFFYFIPSFRHSMINSIGLFFHHQKLLGSQGFPTVFLCQNNIYKSVNSLRPNGAQIISCRFNNKLFSISV